MPIMKRWQDSDFLKGMYDYWPTLFAGVYHGILRSSPKGNILNTDMRKLSRNIGYFQNFSFVI